MKEKDIDEILERAAPNEVDPALLGRISASMAGFQPVRPMAPVWMLSLWLLTISAVIAVTSASALGMAGIRELSVAEIGTIFPALAIFTWLAALLSAAQMTPGGMRWKNPMVMEPVMNSPAMLLLVILLAWVAVDALLFRDFQTGAFIQEGMPCLRAGLIVAIPAGIAAWLILRRGFAVNPSGAGLGAGTLAGLAGLAMLELHCANFLAPHVMVWHTAVIPVSALVGAMLARIAVRRS